jgi:hypothetical protein
MRKWTKNNASVWRLLKLPALMLMCLPAASCVTLGSGTDHIAVDTSCQAFRPITYSKDDTLPTVAEIRAHNRVYDRLCPAPE